MGARGLPLYFSLPQVPGNHHNDHQLGLRTLQSGWLEHQHRRVVFRVLAAMAPEMLTPLSGLYPTSKRVVEEKILSCCNLLLRQQNSGFHLAQTKHVPPEMNGWEEVYLLLPF